MNTQFATDLPKGIQKVTDLPTNDLSDLWDSIIIQNDLKTQLLSQSILNFTVRPNVSRSVLPLHGVILLVGHTGTGKTSLAKGLANKTAETLKWADFRLVEVEAHGLTSSAMGKTQRAVATLFAQNVTELASSGPTIVLLDEVETLAVDRSKLSMDANPVDIHRATDAVLVQLDLLAEAHQNLLFVATSNFREAVDSAFVSRCDLVVEVPLPSATVCRKILKECLLGLGTTYPNVAKLLEHPKLEICASEFVELDGRTIRKTVANALATNPQVATNPNLVTLDFITAAAKAARRIRNTEGGR